MGTGGSLNRLVRHSDRLSWVVIWHLNHSYGTSASDPDDDSEAYIPWPLALTDLHGLTKAGAATPSRRSAGADHPARITFRCLSGTLLIPPRSLGTGTAQAQLRPGQHRSAIQRRRRRSPS